jgi:putative glutathione S-transferase
MSVTKAPVSNRAGVSGRFERQPSRFRDVVPRCPQPGRLHLYVSLACPWAHRTVIARKLKGLEDVVPMTVVDPLRDERGWRFAPERPDPVNGFAYLAQAYRETDPSFEGRVTVPTLYDTVERRVVNNESEDILRMLDGWSDEGPSLFPPELRDELLAVNAPIYDHVNNGVYKAGFASSQEAYEEAFDELFDELDRLDERLSVRRYLVGGQLTEADIRLFTTLIRFDPVYVGHFKCNKRRVADYEHLSGYLRDLYHHSGWADTVDFDHIKRHYYMTHPSINPTGIVPKGPEQDLDAPHGREALGG